MGRANFDPTGKIVFNPINIGPRGDVDLTGTKAKVASNAPDKQKTSAIKARDIESPAAARLFLRINFLVARPGIIAAIGGSLSPTSKTYN
jgi:hypothetical protein